MRIVLHTLLALFVVYLGLFAGLKWIVFPRYFKPSAKHLAKMDFNGREVLKKKMDYLITGDSTAMSNVRPFSLGRKNYSIAISGASAFNTYEELKTFPLENVAKGLVISNSLISESHYGADFWTRYVALGTYSLSDLYSFYEESAEASVFPAEKYSRPEYWLRIFKEKALLNFNSIQALQAAWNEIPQGSNHREAMSKLMSEYHGYLGYPAGLTVPPENFSTPYAADISRHLEVSKSDRYYLQKIIELAKDANLSVYFIETPVASGPGIIDTKIFRQDYEAFFNALVSANKNVFFKQIKQTLPLDNFFDLIHLNQTGAVAIADELHFAVKGTHKPKITRKDLTPDEP